VTVFSFQKALLKKSLIQTSTFFAVAFLFSFYCVSRFLDLAQPKLQLHEITANSCFVEIAFILADGVNIWEFHQNYFVRNVNH
jgi:hypothetical protein